MASRRSFEGPAFLKTLCQKEQRDGDQQDTHGDGGSKRPIVRRAEEALHDVSDHRAGRTADKKWSEEVAERQNEREGGACKEARHRERENDTEKCGALTCAEILGGFEQGTGNVLECRVDGQKDERRVDVR